MFALTVNTLVVNKAFMIMPPADAKYTVQLL